MNKVNEGALKNLGAAGMMKAAGGNLQVIFGTESDMIKEEMKKIIQSGAVKNDSLITLGSPISGKILPLADIPDATFAQGMIGPGVGIEPNGNTVVAPFDGTVVNLFHTKHAIGLESDHGVELLIHIGIDTVKMQGRGFEAFVKQGDKVKAGQKLLEFDLEMIRKEAKSIITPVIITNGAQFKALKPEAAKTVALLDTVATIEK
jgi:PTS system glucose-specific IIC component